MKSHAGTESGYHKSENWTSISIWMKSTSYRVYLRHCKGLDRYCEKCSLSGGHQEEVAGIHPPPSMALSLKYYPSMNMQGNPPEQTQSKVSQGGQWQD